MRSFSHPFHSCSAGRGCSDLLSMCEYAFLMMSIGLFWNINSNKIINMYVVRAEAYKQLDRLLLITHFIFPFYLFIYFLFCFFSYFFSSFEIRICAIDKRKSQKIVNFQFEFVTTTFWCDKQINVDELPYESGCAHRVCVVFCPHKQQQQLNRRQCDRRRPKFRRVPQNGHCDLVY